jgi:hypothetical protein
MVENNKIEDPIGKEKEQNQNRKYELGRNEIHTPIIYNIVNI